MIQHVIFSLNSELGSLSGTTKNVVFNFPRTLQASGAIIRTFVNGYVANSANSISVRVTGKGVTSTRFQASVFAGS